MNKKNVLKFVFLPMIILVIGVVSYFERELNVCKSFSTDDYCGYFLIFSVGKPLLILGSSSLIALLLIYLAKIFSSKFLKIFSIIIIVALVTIYFSPAGCEGYLPLCFDKELVSLLFSTGLLALAVLAVLYKGLRILLKK